MLSLLCHKALTVSFLSAADADSEKDTKKRTAKKAFEINFDEDIEFEAYFRKTKVRVEFLPLSALLLYQCVLELSSANGSSHAL